jgi:hypothetical protein
VAAAPGFAVWKHAKKSLRGEGDVDAILPRRERQAALAAFQAWAERSGDVAVVVCDHVPASTIAVGVGPTGELEQLDLIHAFVLHAAALVGAERLDAVATTGADGDRMLRPGAEGLLRLLREELRAGGRALAADPVEVRELLVVDGPGLEATAALLGAAGPHASRLARAVVGGRWSKKAVLAIELAMLTRAVRDPHLVAACLRFDMRGRRCLVIDALRGGRRLSAPPSAWLERVRATHLVLPARGG